MSKVNINGKEYDFEALTDEQKGQVLSLKFVQEELKRLQAQIAVYKTAEASYGAELNKQLEIANG